MKKKTFAFLLAFVMTLGLLPAPALAGGGWGHDPDEDGCISIGDGFWVDPKDRTMVCHFTDEHEKVTIPDGIVSIYDWAFGNVWEMTTLVIPEGVTSIGDYAFYHCKNLENVTLPSTLTHVGEDAFEGTPWLERMGGTLDLDALRQESSQQTTQQTGHVHRFTESIIFEPGPMYDGLKQYWCQDCGYNYTEAIPREPAGPHEHQYMEEVKKYPTYTEEGEHTMICTICGDSYTEPMPVKPHDHTYMSVIIRQPIAEREGLRNYTCTICGDTYEGPIPKLFQPNTSQAVFSDVPSTFWAFESVSRAAALGITNGMTATTFQPNGPVTNAQFDAMLTRALFPDDVSKGGYVAGKWWDANVSACQSRGLLDGTRMSGSVTSQADQPISRYDMAQMMYNTLKAKQRSLPSQTYIESENIHGQMSDWDAIPAQYQDAVAACYAMELLNGKGDRFAGSDGMTRAEGCTVIIRLLEQL